MSDYLNKIIYLTQEQYEALKSGASIGAETGINNNYLYITDSVCGNASDISAIRTSLGLQEYRNAGYHNSIYRGKNLGTSVTNTQWNAIANGTFDDLYIGDYWTINGDKKVISHFDYYYNTGTNPVFSTHHIITINATNMDLDGYYNLSTYPYSQAITIGSSTYSEETTNKFRWNVNYTAPAEGESEGTISAWTGLYIDSHIYNHVLPAAQAKIEAGIGSSHLLWCKKRLPSTCDSAASPTASGWAGSATRKLDLLNEVQITGSASQQKNALEVGLDKIQIAIFKFDPAFANLQSSYHLRNVFSLSKNVVMTSTGFISTEAAAARGGLRPIEIWG